MSLSTLTVGSSSVRVWRAGPSTGTPVVYLHGFEHHPGDAAFLDQLAESRHVIAPEHPGYGGSSGTTVLEDVVDVALHYRALVESLDLAEVDVIGHCLGGMFAAEFAAMCPDLVRRLILVNAFGLWLPGSDPLDPFALSEERLLAAKWHDPAAAPDKEPSIGLADPDDPYAAPLTKAQNLATATRFMWPIPDRGLSKRLRFVRARTLIIHGVADQLVPLTHAQAFAAEIPDASLLPVVDAGHVPMFEKESEFIEAVQSFLT